MPVASRSSSAALNQRLLVHRDRDPDAHRASAPSASCRARERDDEDGALGAGRPGAAAHLATSCGSVLYSVIVIAGTPRAVASGAVSLNQATCD